MFEDVRNDGTLKKSLRSLQDRLSRKVTTTDSFEEVKTAGGVDQAFSENSVYSGLVVQDESFTTLESKSAGAGLQFPYIPGFLAFREIPAILKVLKGAQDLDILLVDGHGIAHPRRLGLASHVGIVLDIPTVGVAKNVLVGDYREPERVGDVSDLEYDGDLVGKVLKSKEGCNPIFVSPGHRISVDTSLEVVKRFVRDHKLPEPIYEADRLADDAKGRTER